MQHKQTNSNRAARIASKVQTLVSEIIRTDYADDEILSGVSLVGTDSHGGLQFVRLYYYYRDDDYAPAQKRLESITRAIRFSLAQKMNQKYVPEIKFVHDDTMRRAERIDELLRNI